MASCQPLVDRHVRACLRSCIPRWCISVSLACAPLSLDLSFPPLPSPLPRALSPGHLPRYLHGRTRAHAVLVSGSLSVGMCRVRALA